MNPILRRAVLAALSAPAASFPCAGEVRPRETLPVGTPLESVEMTPVPPGHEHEPEPKGIKIVEGKCYVREVDWPALRATLKRNRKRAGKA